MDIKHFISEWLKAANAFDVEKHLSFYLEDAILDDHSVGTKFKRHSGIRKYFENYFIGYKTQTRLVELNIISDSQAHIEMDFTGEFPGGQIGGTFDFEFQNGKIKFVKAELL